jgi:hypothetical protein
VSERCDLNLVRTGTVTLGLDERAARLRRELVLIFVLPLGAPVVAGTCGYVLLFAARMPEPARQHARTVLAGIVPGGVAFPSGRDPPKGWAGAPTPPAGRSSAA